MDYKTAWKRPWPLTTDPLSNKDHLNMAVYQCTKFEINGVDGLQLYTKQAVWDCMIKWQKCEKHYPVFFESNKSDLEGQRSSERNKF